VSELAKKRLQPEDSGLRNAATLHQKHQLAVLAAGAGSLDKKMVSVSKRNGKPD